jgi:hypothetical protein
MDEEELDASLRLRPFGTAEVKRMEARLRRRAALAIALWGRTTVDLQRQLLPRYPQLPSGFELPDYRDLYIYARQLVHVMITSRPAWLQSFGRSTHVVFAGGERFSEWEARCEIVRRAIEFLESR